jgi:hypothetical protein
MPEAKCGFNDGPSVSGADLLVRFGPTLVVNVGFDPAYDVAKPEVTPVPGIQGAQALIDTGAGECCIDSALAASLHLPVVDRRGLSGATGAAEVNMHLAQIYAPTVRFTMYGLFAGVHLAAGGQPHAVLLGRTFLKSFVLTYEGHTGTVILSPMKAL